MSPTCLVELQACNEINKKFFALASITTLLSYLYSGYIYWCANMDLMELYNQFHQCMT